MAKSMNKSAVGTSDKKPTAKVTYKKIGNMNAKVTAKPRSNSVTSGAITGATASGMAKKKTMTPIAKSSGSNMKMNRTMTPIAKTSSSGMKMTRTLKPIENKKKK